MARLRWPIRGRVQWLAVVLSIVALLAAGWAAYQQATVRQDAAAVQTQAKSLADQVAEACAKGGPVAQQLGQACAKAAEVKDQPPVAAQTTAPTVDPVALRQAARTAVVDYCSSANQPCRGADGTTPNFDLIVDAVVGRIPTPKDGTPGADGQPGQNATAAQVADAVAAYCGQPNEPCRGQPGTNGKDGQTPECVSEPGECRGADGQPPAGWTTTYPDGSTGSCTRAPNFDPSAPRYTCTRSAPPSTDPPLPLGGS